MAVYERSTYVQAPLEDVWAFHSRAAGFEALSPEFIDLKLDSVVGPDGSSDPEILEAGSEMVVSVRPFGVGPRARARIRIVERRRADVVAMVRDELVEGPFPRWLHTHQFEASGDGTEIHEHIEYGVPEGVIGGLFSPVVSVGLETAFRDRHRRLRRILER